MMPGLRRKIAECGAMDVALWLLLLASILRLWLMPLGSSFWVDEMATVFVVRHGAPHPSFDAAPQVPASIYYILPRISQAIFGQSEIAYRLPSVLALAAAVLIVSRAAKRLIHPNAAWFGVFTCLALAGLNYQAADARPYALATCISALSIYGLVRWLDSGRMRDALIFGAAAALLWRVHLLLWPFYILFAAYAALRLWRKETRVPWRVAVAVFGAIAVSLLPVAWEALALLRNAASHVITKPPSMHAFEHGLRWNVVLVYGISAYALSRVFRWGQVKSHPAPATIFLIFAWWLIQPVGLYAFSLVSGNSVFVKRYYSVMMPGVALAAMLAASEFIPERMWKKMAALSGVISLAILGQWNALWPAHEVSDWRGAAAEVRRLAIAPDTPVICPSPFIEARPPVWRPDYPLPGFLYSHLPVYTLAGKLYRFPFEASPDAERYASGLTAGRLKQSSRFLILGGNGAVRYWTRWFAERPEMTGWTRTRHPFGDVDVIEFNRPLDQRFD